MSKVRESKKVKTEACVWLEHDGELQWSPETDPLVSEDLVICRGRAAERLVMWLSYQPNLCFTCMNHGDIRIDDPGQGGKLGCESCNG